jgi:spore maturation protein CgeB
VKILCVFGKHNYGNPARGLSYEYANFLPALRQLGHTAIHFESWDRNAYKDFVQLNRSFFKTVEAEQPDVIFCVLMHYEIWLDVLKEVRRKCKTVLVHWGTDDSWKYERFARWVAPAFHLYATTSPEALVKSQKDGLGNFHLTQWAADSGHLAEPLPADQCFYPVSFIGSAYGNRRRWISKLKEVGIDVACFGFGWESGPVKSEEIPRIIRNSIISLNFGDSGLHLGGTGLYRSRQIKARVFEVSGAGGFLLTEDAPHLRDFYNPGEEIAVFSDVNDLIEKIKYFLSHHEQRNAIARAGYERTVKEHTYEHRFGPILDCVRRDELDIDTRCQFDASWFSRLSAMHETGRTLRIARKILVGLLEIFWGRRRGARAARRFIYELSWRLSPERTYTSASIPGRMFYRES